MEIWMWSPHCDVRELFWYRIKQLQQLCFRGVVLQKGVLTFIHNFNWTTILQEIHIQFQQSFFTLINALLTYSSGFLEASVLTFFLRGPEYLQKGEIEDLQGEMYKLAYSKNTR